jgi:hypothetical protein
MQGSGTGNIIQSQHVLLKTRRTGEEKNDLPITLDVPGGDRTSIPSIYASIVDSHRHRGSTLIYRDLVGLATPHIFS